MAAAGQKVFAGPAAAPLSGATAAAAAGPMQARKDGEEGKDYKGTRTAAPAERSAEQVAHGQAAVDALGPELAQDTGWDMDSQMEKRGWWSRNVGKYFYKNNSAKNVFKNIGVGAGLAVGGIPMAIGKGVWSGLKGIGGYFKRSNQEAVDRFNNFDADYQKMGKWDKFKSFAGSPIAWLTAGLRQKGTDERNLRRTKIAAAANIWRGAKAGHVDESDISFDALNQIPQAEQRRDTGATGQESPKLEELGSYGMMAGQYGTMGFGMYKGFEDGSANAYSADAISSAFGAGSSAMTMMNNIISAQNQARVGDKAGTAFHGLLAAGNGLSVIGSGATTTANIAGVVGSSLATNPILTNASSALGIGTGVLNTAAGLTQAISSGKTKSNMTSLMSDMGDAQNLTPEQKRMRKTFEQAHGVANADMTEGIMRSVGGAMQATGSAISLSGVGSLAGTIVGGLGTGVNVVGGMVGGKMRESVGEKQLEKEVNFDKQVEIVKRRFPQLKLSDAEAQDLVLQSMGILSGDKKEAVQRMTMKRAYELTRSANNANDANNAIATRGIEGMGLSKVNGKYSLQGAAQKLGFAKNSSWQDQMKAVQQQGAYYNPFAGKAKQVPAPARQVPNPAPQEEDVLANLPDIGDADDLNEARRRRLSMA